MRAGGAGAGRDHRCGRSEARRAMRAQRRCRRIGWVRASQCAFRCGASCPRARGLRGRCQPTGCVVIPRRAGVGVVRRLGRCQPLLEFPDLPRGLLDFLMHRVRRRILGSRKTAVHVNRVGVCPALSRTRRSRRVGSLGVIRAGLRPDVAVPRGSWSGARGVSACTGAAARPDTGRSSVVLARGFEGVAGRSCARVARASLWPSARARPARQDPPSPERPAGTQRKSAGRTSHRSPQRCALRPTR